MSLRNSISMHNQSMILKYNEDDDTPISPCGSDTSNISAKILCRNEFRRFKIDRSQSFDSLARQVETMFAIAPNENIRMKFTDDEGSNCCSYSYKLVRIFFF